MIVTASNGQKWHNANDTLKYPHFFGSAVTTIGWINQYDTLSCKYKFLGDDIIYEGYKIVYLYNGYYIDDNNTYNIFFDNKKQAIKDVSVYEFN